MKVERIGQNSHCQMKNCITDSLDLRSAKSTDSRKIAEYSIDYCDYSMEQFSSLVQLYLITSRKDNDWHFQATSLAYKFVSFYK